jgi:hypothetical protein
LSREHPLLECHYNNNNKIELQEVVSQKTSLPCHQFGAQSGQWTDKEITIDTNMLKLRKSCQMSWQCASESIELKTKHFESAQLAEFARRSALQRVVGEAKKREQ